MATSNNEKKTALDQLKEQQPNVPMPLDVPVSSGYLNIAATHTKQGYSIFILQNRSSPRVEC